jgi:hypothetical protein
MNYVYLTLVVMRSDFCPFLQMYFTRGPSTGALARVAPSIQSNSPSSIATDTVHSTENPIYVFPEMKLRGLVPSS